MKVSVTIEEIIARVTREVLRECSNRGIAIQDATRPATSVADTSAQRLDMNGFRTPIVTEHDIEKLHEQTSAIIVPNGTIVTPRAKELIRKKNISVVVE
jgi:hypothetical protein